MSNTYKKVVLKTSVVILFMFIKAIYCEIRIDNTLFGSVCFFLQYMLEIAIVTLWAISIKKRITHDWIRYYLLFMAEIMIFWMLIRTCKHRIFESGLISRHLWYAYYIPMILLPLWGFFCSLCMGKREDERFDKRWFFLYVPAVLMIAGIMTNDIHQCAFNFGGTIPLNYEARGSYVYGPLYYIIALWMIGLSFFMIGFLFWKCRVKESRSVIWLPLMLIPLGILYTVLYIAGFRAFDLTSTFCFLEMAIMESVIDSGLINSSTHYKEIFTASSLNVTILNQDGKVAYKASSAKPVSKEEFNALKENGFLERGHGNIIRMNKISGGYTVWNREPDRINRVIDELMGIEQELRSSAEILSEEIKVKRHKFKIDEQMRLYRKVATHTRHQYEKIRAYFSMIDKCQNDDERASVLAHIALLGAFIKRESNLVLLAESNEMIASAELKRCFEESMENLKPFGIDYALNINDTSFIYARSGVSCYEYVESVLEEIMDKISLLLVTVENRKDALFCSLRYELDGEEYLLNRYFPERRDLR